MRSLKKQCDLSWFDEVRCQLTSGRTAKKKHVGSSFDGFLVEAGVLSETEATAVKRVIAYQLSQFMEENKVYFASAY